MDTSILSKLKITHIIQVVKALSGTRHSLIVMRQVRHDVSTFLLLISAESSLWNHNNKIAHTVEFDTAKINCLSLQQITPSINKVLEISKDL